ncbi:Putative O-methyltransferase [Piscirickettsia salmonis]|uniref:O-methyltransferase n=2 Tax=Piscirickettsia salmonis TaxID=1238 RepID=UPI0012B7C728|nr:class I SAM-dependent methyltransferase [Piscirickettsia salmonis]QGP50715.1 Putative O-methyltransferase [Piscirickettsia salmonis]QGP54072.1 Putative O-methyltransferase [Piscirickettsia salmonis]QGP60034.1 Putative O-methyltransferase [Piscirickettsia salmonis]QGP63649.1 Putative O-methyltransferase [Piscirickettsia salmonis]
MKNMPDIVNADIEQYCHEITQPESPLLRELVADTWENMSGPQMMTGRVPAKLLRMLIQLMGAKYVLELGTYTGYSALTIAEALPEDGQVISCDVNPMCKSFSRYYFEQSPHGYKIDLRIAPAFETIMTLPENHFDLVFLDADKANYLKYYEATLSKLVRGGLLVIDNALWYGEVLVPRSKHAIGVHELNAHLTADERVENVLLTVRDGMHLVRKK